MRGLERFTGGSSAQKYGKLRQLLDRGGGRSINVPRGPLREDACRRLLDLVNSRRDFGTGIPQEFYNSIFGNRLKRRFLLVETTGLEVRFIRTCSK